MYKRQFQDRIQALQGEPKDFGQVLQLIGGAGNVFRMMALGENGQFKREAAGEGAKENVTVIFRDHPGATGAFGVEDIAEEAALLEKIMVVGAVELAFDKGRNDRKRHELGVSVAEGRSGACLLYTSRCV